MRSLWLTMVSVAALLPIGSGCSRPIAAEPVKTAKTTPTSSLDRVTAGPPQRKPLKLYTTQPGRVEAFEETPLFPKISGYVEQVLVDIGDPVKRDQSLIELRVPEMQDELKQKDSLVALAEAELKQADATVEAAQAAAETAQAKVLLAEAGVGRAESEYRRWEAEHARIKDLAGSGSVTKKLLEETLHQFGAAEASQREAGAQVQSAQAALKEAQVNIRSAQADVAAAAARLEVAKANREYTKTLLGYTAIKAPFNGVVTRRTVDSGHYVYPASGGATKPLLMVARTDKIRVSFDVPELEAPLVDPNDSASVRIQSLAGKQFDASVARTSWSLDSTNRSLRAEVDLDNSDGHLRPGMYAMVSILLDHRDNALVLPVTAITRDGDQAYCFTVNSGTVKRTQIKLGLRSGDEIEVSGINENQLVVLARAESLKDGQQVEISTPAK
jgi:HlyD family secretion protein